jgi:hypothetical protein
MRMSGKELEVRKGQEITQGFGSSGVASSGELAAAAVQAAAKAEIESAYIMAMRNPRNEENARVAIEARCKDPEFAKKAIYKKPIGKETIAGPSIRFAEEMLRLWKNIKTIQSTIFEDGEKRIVKITTVDLEANTSYSKEVTILKQVERYATEGRQVIDTRVNSKNKTVSIVVATEDELLVKESALASKIVRTNGLRLIPEHIISRAMSLAENAASTGVNDDPETDKRNIADGFATIGVKPSMLEDYLGQSLSSISRKQIEELRGIFTTISDGEAVWADYVNAKNGDDGGDKKKEKKK